ncbi:MAG: hypothetical protein ABR962_05025 [Candidatus Bathyarchaeia archaeon]|jgi:hypothetical protein
MVGGYAGNTFVAFLDILGFRDLVEGNVSLAAQTLDKFYSTIYEACSNPISRRIPTDRISRNNPPVQPESNAIVASDCAVIFSRNTESGENMSNDLKCMLDFITTVNSNLVKPDPVPSILTICSIAYGWFVYEDRKESSYLKKNCFLGTPYMNAFSDSEKMKKELGLCRLLKSNLPERARASILTLNSLLVEENGNYYFYWMLRNRSLLSAFLEQYKRASAVEGPLKYERIKEVLGRYNSSVQE